MSIGPRLAFAVLLVLPATVRSEDPNLLVEVRQALVEAAVGKTIDRPEYISDVISGAKITGSGRSQGVVTVTLVPSPDKAVMDLVLRGATTSRTVGVKGPVQLYTNNLTTYTAVKRVILTPDGLVACPARATSDQDTDLDCIATDFRCRPLDRLTRRVAGRVYTRKEAEGREEGAAKAARRVEQGFDNDAAEELAKANESYRRDVRDVLEKRGLFPESLVMSTTADALHIRARLGNTPGQSAPPPVVADSEVSIRVHESMFNTLTTRQFGGKTYKPEQLAEEIETLLSPRAKTPKKPPAKTPKKPPVKPDTDVEITFAKLNPIEARFRDGRISVTIHGARFRADDEDYEAMDITTRYVLRKTATGVQAVREKELIIVPPDYVPGKTKLKSSQIALRRILQRRLDADGGFPERLELEEVKLTGPYAKLGTLHTTQADAIDGWLVIGLKRAMPAVPVPVP